MNLTYIKIINISITTTATGEKIALGKFGKFVPSNWELAEKLATFIHNKSEQNRQTKKYPVDCRWDPCVSVFYKSHCRNWSVFAVLKPVWEWGRTQWVLPVYLPSASLRVSHVIISPIRVTVRGGKAKDKDVLRLTAITITGE